MDGVRGVLPLEYNGAHVAMPRPPRTRLPACAARRWRRGLEWQRADILRVVEILEVDPLKPFLVEQEAMADSSLIAAYTRCLFDGLI